MNPDFPVYNDFNYRYLGVRLVDLTPARATPVNEPTVVVQYADGEVSWFQRIADKELWLFRSSDAGEQELSSIIDRRKWKRRKISVEESSRRCVIDVCLRVTLFFFNSAEKQEINKCSTIHLNMISSDAAAKHLRYYYAIF